jgi:hypothetical protein
MLAYARVHTHARARARAHTHTHRTDAPWLLMVDRHGLIMGCSVTGRKPLNGPSLPKLQLGPKAEQQAQVNVDTHKHADKHTLSRLPALSS